MFILEDGREHLYQWDVNRRVQVEDPTITEVHFCNRTDECSLVVEVETEEIAQLVGGREITLRTANIPNIILQNPWDIRVFAYCADGYTKVEKVFEVKARSKPADYVYTETEVKNFESLEKHLDERIDEIAREGIKTDLTGYATEQWVEDKGYLTEHQSLEGYATEDYVDKAIENIDIPEPEKVDLTGYAKEQWVKDQGYLTEHQDLSSYAKRTDIPTKVSQLNNDKGYLTKHQDISHLATIGQVQSVEDKIPTKTSQITNDSGFLTQHQDLSHLAPLSHTHPSYALKTEIPDISGKADKEHIHLEYAKKSEIPSTEGLATEVYVDDAIAQAQLGGGEVDLSAYAKKSEIPDVSDFISEIPSEYVTDSELAAKGYATGGYVDSKIAGIAIPSLEGYATEKYVDNAIANIELPEGGDVDLSNYYTKEETDQAIYNSKDAYYIRIPSDTPTDADNPIVAEEDLAEFANRYVTNKNVCLHFYEYGSSNTTNGFKTATIASTVGNKRIVFRDSNIDIKALAQNIGTSYWEYTLKDIDGIWYIYKTAFGHITIATKEYVDSLFEGIATAEGGAY